MNNQFNYKYVAPTEEERKEIESIRRQYIPKEQSESKIERIRKLDFAVKNTPTVLSLCLGIIGCLVFGLGLTMILEWNILSWGIVVMVVGLVPMLISYPVYKKMLTKNKQLHGDEILKLTEEILSESKNNNIQ